MEINEEEWPNRPRDIMLKMLKTGICSDLTFIVGNESERCQVKAHAVIFISSSSYFFEKLKNQEFSTSKPMLFTVENISPKTFQLLMDYLYTGESGAKVMDTPELYIAAQKFEFKHLEKRCQRLLKNGLKVNNVLQIYQKLIHFNLPQLSEYALMYICRNASEVIKTAEFGNLPEKCLVEIVKQDDLEIYDELELFNAVLRWGQAECLRRSLESNDSEIRSVFQIPFTYIRFPCMDKVSFAKNVVEKSLLIGEDLSSMMLYFFSKIEDRSPLPLVRFNSNKRKYKSALEFNNNSEGLKKPKLEILPATYPVSRGGDGPSAYSSCKTKGNVEVLMFTANESLYLVGFKVLIGPSTVVYNDWEYDYSQLTCTFVVEKVGEKSPLYKKEREPFAFGFLFDFGVRIEKDQSYQITISFSGEIKGRPFSEETFKRLPLSKVQMFISGNYKSSQTLAILDEDSESCKTVTITFHREATGTKKTREIVPLNVGIIRELLVQLE